MGLTKKKKNKVFKRDGGKCQRCGRRLHQNGHAFVHNPKRAIIHHIIPVASGGTHGLYNMKLTCNRCERKHHNKRTKEEKLDDLIKELRLVKNRIING